MHDKPLRILASIGLAVGGALGMAGTFASSATLRGLAWGIDGAALVMASALLTIRFFRSGQDLAATGFLVFAVGEGVILSGAATGVKTAVHVNGTLNNPADTDRGWTVEIAFPWKAPAEHARHNGAPHEGEQWRINFSRVEWQIATTNGAYVKVPKARTLFAEDRGSLAGQTRSGTRSAAEADLLA